MLIRVVFHQVDPNNRPAQALLAEVDARILRDNLIKGGLIALVVAMVVRTCR